MKLSLLPQAQTWHGLETASVLLYPESREGQEGEQVSQQLWDSASEQVIFPLEKLCAYK